MPVSPLALDGSDEIAKPLSLATKIDEPEDKFPRTKLAARPTPTPSPLGLSNYEALDHWNGYDDDLDGMEVSFDVEEDEPVYSDFNFLDSDPSGPTDDRYEDPFSHLPTDLTPPLTPTEQQPVFKIAAPTKCSPNWCSSPVTCQVCG
jgi:hypothetical protein